MNFKEWLLQLEAIDASTKDLLLKAKAPKDQLDAFVKELEDEPNLIDKKTAFQRFQSKFNIKKKVKDEEGQRQFFANVPNTTEEELKTYDYYKDENPQALREMMELLRKFIDKKLITLKFENNKPVLIRNTLQGEQKFDTPDFTRFTDGLHQIQASLEQYKGKGNYFNPIEEELNHQNNLVAKGDNVWVFRGHAPDVCRIYGKGHPWCISSSTSAAHWFSYRIRHHQTQYFVFDFNKDEDDPARYVNPGVAPKGMYSEWVDARNQHKTDPEDRNSDVGINGYSSIIEYKKYLASKKIPLDTWTTTPPEEWEIRLSNYDDNHDFAGAKNDTDPRVFSMYLKISSYIEDSNFETLDKEQKKEFILGKINITENQLDYAIENFKGEYFNSLNLNGKISFAVRTNDQDLFLKLAQNKNFSDYNISDFISDLLYYAKDKDKFIELIIKYKKEISDDDFYRLLYSATDKEKIAMIIINTKKELTDNNVFSLLSYAKDKDKIAELLQKEEDNISKLSDNNVNRLLDNAKDKDKMAKIIIKYKKELYDDNIKNLLDNATDKDQIAKLIINKIPELSDYNVRNLLNSATEKDQIADLIINKLPELSNDDVRHLLRYAKDKDHIAELLQKKENKDYIGKLPDDIVSDLLYNVKNKDQMAKIIIKYKKELSGKNVFLLLFHATDKDEIAELLQQNVDNISKLPDGIVEDLLHYAPDRKQMAQIINKYHQRKTPEIQEEIDKYLS